jgi:hypothetical protein
MRCPFWIMQYTLFMVSQLIEAGNVVSDLSHSYFISVRTVNENSSSSKWVFPFSPSWGEQRGEEARNARMKEKGL